VNTINNTDTNMTANDHAARFASHAAIASTSNGANVVDFRPGTYRTGRFDCLGDEVVAFYGTADNGKTGWFAGTRNIDARGDGEPRVYYATRWFFADGASDSARNDAINEANRMTHDGFDFASYADAMMHAEARLRSIQN
jgi:hypothetical protein